MDQEIAKSINNLPETLQRVTNRRGATARPTHKPVFTDTLRKWPNTLPYVRSAVVHLPQQKTGITSSE